MTEYQIGLLAGFVIGGILFMLIGMWFGREHELNRWKENIPSKDQPMFLRRQAD